MEQLKKLPYYILLLATVTGVAAIGILQWTINSSVSEAVEKAQAANPQSIDAVDALIAYMNTEKHDLEERNRAIWALGQIGDPRALPALQAAYTGEACDHEATLCQQELEKAIKHCKGETFRLLAYLG